MKRLHTIRRRLLFLAVLSLAAGPPLPAAAPPPDSAVRAFERFAGLAGDWEGKSTKGWTERLRFQVIAKGSAILETSVDAHPAETMATLFSLDAGNLELRHYCVAGNQPHLRATSFEEEGRRVTFTFVDGGNLASRDRGHMDKAVYLFEDSDHVMAQWTWYQDGKERWMEEIRLVRKP